MKEIKSYYSETIPEASDLMEGIRIARTNNCFVKILWNVYQGSYEVLIKPSDSLENIFNKMPEVYGL